MIIRCLLLSVSLALYFIFMVGSWVGLSGVGGYVWQNSDHECRNAIFDLLVENGWPVIDTVMVESIPQERVLVYYIGFWLVSALIFLGERPQNFPERCRECFGNGTPGKEYAGK